MANRGLRADSQSEALSGGPRIRIARAADVPGILALMRPYYAEDGYPFESRRAARVLRAFLRRPALGPPGSSLSAADDGSRDTRS